MPIRSVMSDGNYFVNLTNGAQGVEAYEQTLRPRCNTTFPACAGQPPQPGEGDMPDAEAIAQAKKAFLRCERRLRKENLDQLRFMAHEASTVKALYCRSPGRVDGTPGRVYQLGTEKLKL